MKRIGILILIAGLSMAMGCQGELAILDGSSSLDPGGVLTPGGTAGGGTGGSGTGSEPIHTQNPEFPDIECSDAACRDPQPSAPPRFVRLTHSQWENTVRDLFRLDTTGGYASSFIQDPLSSGNFDTNTEVLSMTQRLWDNYRIAAEEIASQIARDPEALARIVPADALESTNGLEARARAFIEDFGMRAYRRPLSSTEIDTHVELFLRGAELMNSSNAFEAGVEVLLRLFIQSPHFVYRTELTHDEARDAFELNAFERASKLAYALWNTMPDDPLFAAARRGDLDTREGLEVEVRRMLEDVRAEEVVARFNSQLFHFKDYSEMVKDSERFPEFSRDVAEDMRLEMELFVRDIVFNDPTGSIESLYRAPHSFVNRALADIYELEGEFDDGFARAELDPTQRAGILTRLGWLAYESTAYEKNSIHRGVFVALHVLCTDLPPIPDDAQLGDTITGNTNRERIEDATVGCGGTCHGLFINPAGFAFENYDAVGRYQEFEGPHPIDASGEYAFSTGRKSFQNAIEFSEIIGTSPDAHDCYVRNLFEYAYGRQPTHADEPLIARLSQASQLGMTGIREIIVRLVVNDIFVSRAKSTVQEAL